MTDTELFEALRKLGHNPIDLYEGTVSCEANDLTIYQFTDPREHPEFDGEVKPRLIIHYGGF